MKINISEQSYANFWQQPAECVDEFWAFTKAPKAKPGELIEFFYKGKVVAKATVLRIEGPGVSGCAKTCRFKNRYKLFWKHSTFEDLRDDKNDHRNT